MKFNRIALALLLAPLAAQAEVTLTPFATYQWFDSQTIEEISNQQAAPDLQEKEGYAVALGYRFTPAIGLEANYGRTNTATTIVPGIGAFTHEDVRNSRVSLDGYYAFNAEGSFSPYLLLGVGQNNLKDKTSTEAVQDTVVNAAFGAFYHFNEYVALRAEARDVHNVDADLDDQIALLGLEFSTGTSKAAAASTPEPVAEQAPVEELAAAPAVVAAVVDTDGDGVADSSDSCPNTPAGVQVDASGCPLDTDKDGVADYLDKCPDTKAGASVDSTGCYEILKQAVAIDINVTFDSGKADLHANDSAEVQKVAEFMKKYSTVNVTIEGHTDSRGNAAKNKQLSQKRADAVKAELVKQGIDAARLTAVGYGAEKPIADNKTEEGRTKNRRVVASAKAQAETIKMKK